MSILDLLCNPPDGKWLDSDTDVYLKDTMNLIRKHNYEFDPEIDLVHLVLADCEYCNGKQSQVNECCEHCGAPIEQALKKERLAYAD